MLYMQNSLTFAGTEEIESRGENIFWSMLARPALQWRQFEIEKTVTKQRGAVIIEILRKRLKVYSNALVMIASKHSSSGFKLTKVRKIWACCETVFIQTDFYNSEHLSCVKFDNMKVTSCSVCSFPFISFCCDSLVLQLWKECI